jgi:hypothetical protein
MSEEPKSIWKKSWKGPCSLVLAWLGLMVASWIIFLVIMLVIRMPIGGQELDLLAALEFGATVLFFGALFICWVSCWKNFRRFLFGCACLATLTALIYAEEDWRGRHAWSQFKKEWEAKGEKFNFEDFIPPPVPDSDNFAMAPVFETTDKLASRKWRDEHQNRNRGPNDFVWDVKLVDPLDINLGPEPQPTKDMGYWQQAERCDLQVWQEYYRDLAAKTNTYPVAAQPQSPAADVLLALSTYDAVLEQLRQAALRPESRFPLDYDDEDPAEILLPHLATLKRCCLILRLRAIAELENGQSDKALEDVKLGLRLAESIRTEPFIITHLVRIAMVQLALQPVWEGLAGHKWSDAQLAELESALARLNFLADYQFSVRGERAMHTKVLNWMEERRSRYWNVIDMVDSSDRAAMNNFGKAAEMNLMPKGWYYENELTIARLDQNWVLPAADEAQRTLSPQKIAQAQKTIEASAQSGIFSLFARLLVPSLGNYAKKAAYGQNAANLARTALALERYRLANGGYPEALESLVPQFIAQVPHDVIGGQPSPGSAPASQPLKYRREANGRFVLYSVGWNETDDGGVMVFKKKPATEELATDLDLEQGDWVWRYPAK